MKYNIFCWLLLIRSNVLSLKEVLHFRGERNQGPQPENVVHVNTKPVVTDEITACFRLWYRYPGTQTLLGPNLGATTFWFEINTGTGWVWFGHIFRRFVWSEAKPLKWYSLSLHNTVWYNMDSDDKDISTKFSSPCLGSFVKYELKV